MSALKTIQQYQGLWQMVLPHVPAPEPQDVARWVDYTTDSVEHAIMRTAKRFAREKITPKFAPIHAYKFASATARSINEQKTQHGSVIAVSTTSTAQENTEHAA